MAFDWIKKKVLVTGGASFIGSHLVDALLARGAIVRVVDDLSSGIIDNLKPHLTNNSLELINADLREPGIARESMKDIQIVFHIAADHGGRGYVDKHQSGPASNLFLDGVVFWEAAKAKVEKVIFASSGCVYPNYIQQDTTKEIYLTEDQVGPPYEADNMYGWAKLMGEFTLKAYWREFGLKSSSCRYFTVYGPRAKEDHAIIAMIARAFIQQDPFEVWGTGEQIRNWTYVQDIVEGTILAAERIDDGSAINLGTTERIRVIDAVQMIVRLFDYNPKITKLTDMPVGPLNRVASNHKANELLGWQPKFSLNEGLKETVRWYRANRSREQVLKIFSEGGLIKRKVEVPATTS